jgi:hypothetical protein
LDFLSFFAPTRREAIRLTAENPRDKLLSLCPARGTPDFWWVERLPGLPGADCGAPTRETRVIPAQTLADPGRCDCCNP